MLRKIRRRSRHQDAELDITAFMNLMVILVPFLLVTAVFSRVTILDLYLPPQSSAEANQKNPFRLEIILANDSLVVQEHRSGLRKAFSIQSGNKEIQELRDTLIALKQQFPDRTDVSILASPDVKYDLLVKVMDHARMREVNTGDRIQLQELFPNISIGDAPVTGS